MITDQIWCYAHHTHTRAVQNLTNTGINIGAGILNPSGIIRSLERISRTAIAMKSLSRKGGALSQPGPKQPRIGLPAKPARGEQLPQQQPGHFPHTGGTLSRLTPQGTPRPFQPPPPAAPARGRLGPRAGTRRAAAPHSPAGMAAPATKGPNGGSSPALPTAPRAYADALLCRRPRQRSASSSRGVTSCSAPSAPPLF